MKEKSHIVLSFDDGRKDNYRVIKKILLPENLPATFNITTGYVKGEIEQEGIPCRNEAMTVEEIRNIAESGIFEIAGHGYAHTNDLQDWEKGIQDLKDWLGDTWGNDGIGVASPHSGLSREMVLERQNDLKALNVKYVRLGLRNQTKLTQRIISRIARKIGSPWLFVSPVKSSVGKLGKTETVYSIPILHYHSIEQVLYLVNYVSMHKQDCVLQFHSILQPGEIYYEDMFSWDYRKFERLCIELRNLENRGNLKISKCIDFFAGL